MSLPSRRDYQKKLIRLHPREDSFEVSQGRTVLSTGLDGFISPGGATGLFVHQTRMLSCYRWRLDGLEPVPVALSNVEQHTWLGYYIQEPSSVPKGKQDRGSGEMEEVTERSIELRLSRSVSDGLHEDVDVTNYKQQPIQLRLDLECDADFCDQLETVRKREQFGEITRQWRRNQQGNWEIHFHYAAKHHYEHQGDIGDASIDRSVTIEFGRCGSAPSYNEGTVSFSIDLEPLATWHTCVLMRPRVENEPSFPIYDCYAFGPQVNRVDTKRTDFRNRSTTFSTPGGTTFSDTAVKALEQATQDLASLRLHDLDQSEEAWTTAAGIPIFVALFGRDTLTTSREAMMLTTEIMRGTLSVIAKLQGSTVDDWRDEQPGRMLHEAHTGPLAKLGYNPRARYYGSATTSGYYPIVLSELWRWSGDEELIRPYIEPALAGLRWKDRWADLDGDGFYEYLTHSTQGVKNQGWKDSRDAIVDGDGRQIQPPIATCEDQAYVYQAKVRMAEMLKSLGRRDEAKRLHSQAVELKKRFNEAFWMEEKNFFALGLDPRKRQIDSITSNPGHCVDCGILDDSLIETTVHRLMAEDMFTGFGIRTLSADNPAFNPYSYHRGSVWPVEHGTIARGFMRYGMFEELHRLVKGMFEAMELFDFLRLPEVFSGHQRDDCHPFPALYPKTNWPQAWSSAAVFSLLQSMLGIEADAPSQTLLVNPKLPEWLPEISIANLRVGKAVVTLRFVREQDGDTRYEIVDQRGSLNITLKEASHASRDDLFQD